MHPRTSDGAERRPSVPEAPPLHTREVAGSKPAAPIRETPASDRFLSLQSGCKSTALTVPIRRGGMRLPTRSTPSAASRPTAGSCQDRTGSSTGRRARRTTPTDFTTTRRERPLRHLLGHLSRRWSPRRRPTEILEHGARVRADLAGVAEGGVLAALDLVEGANRRSRAMTRTRADLASGVRGGHVAIGGAEPLPRRPSGSDRRVQAVVHWVAVGGGVPFFPRDHRVDLELVETRTFSSRMVYLRYRAAGR